MTQVTVTPQTRRKPRLLVVDDDPGLLRLLTIRLRAENYDVEAADNALSALAAMARVRPDLVITDLKMDQMDGIGLLNSSNSWIEYIGPAPPSRIDLRPILAAIHIDRADFVHQLL